MAVDCRVDRTRNKVSAVNSCYYVDRPRHAWCRCKAYVSQILLSLDRVHPFCEEALY